MTLTLCAIRDRYVVLPTTTSSSSQAISHSLCLSLTLIETVYANVVYIVKLCHVVYVVVIIVFIKSSGGDDVFESILEAAHTAHTVVRGT